jgi:hypothetical protein
VNLDVICPRTPLKNAGMALQGKQNYKHFLEEVGNVGYPIPTLALQAGSCFCIFIYNENAIFKPTF